ncbi:MAG: histidine kinase [Cytophagales bacterium]|nr:histidine kinase [Cytophagales bacterium]
MVLGVTAARDPAFSRLSCPPTFALREIYCTYQDSNGLVWFGTDEGLYSYDGYEYRHYDNEVQGDFAVGHILEVNGNLWLGCLHHSGLWIFDKASGKPRKADAAAGFPPYFSRLYHIGGLLLDNDHVWVCGTLADHKTSVLVRYCLHTHKCKTYVFRNPSGVDLMKFTGLAVARQNGALTVWIGSNTSGLFAFDPAKKQYRIHKLGSATVISLQVSPSLPVLWVGNETGVYGVGLDDHAVKRRFQNQTGNANSLSDNRVRGMVEVDGHLWVTTRSGLNQVDLNSGRVRRYKSAAGELNTLAINDLHSISLHQKMLWITTFGDGVNLVDLTFNAFSFYQFDKPKGITANTITTLAAGRDGATPGVWIGTDNGFYFMDSHSGRLQGHSLDKRKPFSIYSIQQVGQWLWKETEGRFTRYDIARRRTAMEVFSPHVNDTLSQTTYFADGFRDEPLSIWLGSWAQGITYLNTRTGQIRTYDPTRQQPSWGGQGRQALFLETVEQGVRKHVFYLSEIPNSPLGSVTPRNCLVRLDPATGGFTFYAHKAFNAVGKPAPYLLSLHSSGDSVLWLGSQRQGLVKFNVAKGRFERFRSHSETDIGTIYSAMTDTHGNVWMCTASGLAKLDIRSGQVTHYREQQLAGHYGVSMVRDETGKIYVGGGFGLAVFHPDSLQPPGHSHPILLTSFKVFDKEHGLQASACLHRNIALAHNQNFVSFGFAALDYRTPDQTEYAYRLVGVDPGWVFAGNRRYVSYAQLAPGQYEFRVKSNHKGVWGKQWLSVMVTIAPPWWATWWFKAPAVVLALLLLLAVHRLRVRSLRKRQTDLEQQVQQRTSEIIRQKEELDHQREQLARINQYLTTLSGQLEERVQLRTAEIAKANEALRRKNEEITQALVKGQLQERQRVANELHDNLGGLLSALKLNLEAMRTDHLSSAERKLYENVLNMVAGACVEVRNISHHLLPETLEREGLAPALVRFAQAVNSGGRLQLELDLFGLEKPLDKSVEVNVYPICIELVNNVIKHASATVATLQVVRTDDELTVLVADNGIGMTGGDDTGIGLKNIRSRATALNGICQIDSTSAGTTVTIEIPLRKPQAV